jgi:hypothetical protein
MTSKLVALSKLSGKVLVPFYSSKKSTHTHTHGSPRSFSLKRRPQKPKCNYSPDSATKNYSPGLSVEKARNISKERTFQVHTTRLSVVLNFK